MGTYFALMEDAAKRGEDYERLDHIIEILRRIDEGQAKPDEISRVVAVLTELESRIADLVNQATPKKAVEEKTDQVQEVVRHLEALKKAIQFSAEPSSSAVRT